VGHLWRQMPLSGDFFYKSPDKNLTFLSKSPVKKPPFMFPQWGPYGARCSISRANGLFIHFYLPEPQLRSSPTKYRENIQSPSMQPQVDIWPTYNGAMLVPWGLFMTLLSLSQCHAAFSTIPSTLAWADQSPISQCVL
jgi:hypothetical protein